MWLAREYRSSSDRGESEARRRDRAGRNGRLVVVSVLSRSGRGTSKWREEARTRDKEGGE